MIIRGEMIRRKEMREEEEEKEEETHAGEKLRGVNEEKCWRKKGEV